jgi:hypothetical protein
MCYCLMKPQRALKTLLLSEVGRTVLPLSSVDLLLSNDPYISKSSSVRYVPLGIYWHFCKSEGCCSEKLLGNTYVCIIIMPVVSSSFPGRLLFAHVIKSYQMSPKGC